MLACNAATATSERYSLTKPSPTLNSTIPAMIAAVGRSPVSPRDRWQRQAEGSAAGYGVAERELPASCTRRSDNEFEPKVRRRAVTSSVVRPSSVASSALRTSATKLRQDVTRSIDAAVALDDGTVRSPVLGHKAVEPDEEV